MSRSVQIREVGPGETVGYGAAWQAKYHRLTALVLMSGAGLVSCISFVWLSAPESFKASGLLGRTVEGVQVQRMRLGAPDATGRRCANERPS